MLLERARQRKGANVSTSDYEDEIADAAWPLDELREAFSVNMNRTLFNSVQDRIWAWPREWELQYPPLKQWRGNSSPVNTEELANELTKYIERPWLQHDIIDGAALNAFLFSALSSAMDLYRLGAFGPTDWAFMLRKFGYDLHPFWYALINVVLSWIVFPVLRWIMLPAAAAALMYVEQVLAAEIVFGLWIAYVVLRLATFRGRRRKKKEADRTTSAMRAAWEHSCGEVINPTRLRDLVVDAEQKGAINYPSVLHTLLDRAIQRDPTALFTSKQVTA